MKLCRLFPCSSPRWTPLLTVLLAVLQVGAAEPTVEDIVFRAEIDSHEERYVRILPVDFDAQQPHDLLLALHGHGSDRWQFVKQKRDECRAARDTAAKHQMIFISPDYRAATSWMGPKAEADVVQIIHETKRRYTIRNVVVSGGSMGGTGSLTFAVLHPELVDGVVAMNGTANLWEYETFRTPSVPPTAATNKPFPQNTSVAVPNLHRTA